MAPWPQDWPTILVQVVCLSAFAYALYVLFTMRKRPKSDRIPAIGLCLFSLILASIVLPVAARDHGSPAMRCVSNAKQIGLTLAMYAADNDDRFPTSDTLRSALTPPMLSRQTFRCPSAMGSFGYAVDRTVLGAATESIRSPAEAVLLFECDAPNPFFAAGRESLPIKPRHDGKDTVAFVDGHARLLPRGDPSSVRD